jgi:Kef-type K+ transport system membrane component KefB
MWARLGLLILLTGLPVWAQTAERADIVGPPVSLKQEFVGPPSPFQPLPIEPEPQFPLPNIPLLDQELEQILLRSPDLDYLVPTPAAAVKSILGFAFLLGLAYIAGHPRVTELERQLGIAHLATTGLPFVLLGFIAAQRDVGVLSPGVLMEIAPLLTLSLGWLGFSIGYRFDWQLMEKLPAGIGKVVWPMAILPFITVSGASGLLMYLYEGGMVDRTLVRDAILLGLAGAMAAKSSPYLWEDRGLSEADLDRMAWIVQLGRIVSIFGLMTVAAYFRTDDSVVLWQLPSLAWLFVTLGVGAALGVMTHALMTASHSDAESLVLLLGSVSFAAGMAHYLRLSAISVCFLVGVVLANAPSRWKGAVEGVTEMVERPVYFLFLLIAGAIWFPEDWRGWALMLIFVASRLIGNGIGAALVTRQGAYVDKPAERQWLTYAPAGAVSLAVVISAQNLYGGPRISWIVTAVIAGSLLNEILVQVILRRGRSTLVS